MPACEGRLATTDSDAVARARQLRQRARAAVQHAATLVEATRLTVKRCQGHCDGDEHVLGGACNDTAGEWRNAAFPTKPVLRDVGYRPVLD